MRFLTLTVLTVLASSSLAQDKREFPAFKFKTPPVIDGQIDIESEWKGVPSRNDPFCDDETVDVCPEMGEFWLAYDDKFIYFAARMKDSSPSTIKAVEYRTNVSLDGDDTIELSIDPIGSLTEFSRFSMNARGATAVKISGGRALKREWIGEFVAKGSQTQTGWQVEAKIPWAMIHLPKQGKRTMRFNVSRTIPRLDRTYDWMNTTGGNKENTGKWLDVICPDVPNDRTIKMLPYTYGGVDSNGKIFNSGLDLKTKLTDDMEFVATINPDFRNIENQILSLDHSYFERLAGETRPFFNEGQGNFQTGFDTKIFASQRIKDVDVGAKTYGHLDSRTKFGLLDTIDFGNQNNFVGSISRQINSDLSLSYAQSISKSPTASNEAGFVSIGQRSGPYFFYSGSMYSRDTVTGFGMNNYIGSFYELKGLNLGLDYTDITPNFNPKLGFAPSVGFHGPTIFAELTRTCPKAPISQFSFQSFATSTRDQDGHVYQRSFEIGPKIAFKNELQLSTFVSISQYQENHDKTTGFGFSYPKNDPYRNVGAFFVTGEVAGEPYHSASLNSSYRISQKIQTDFQAQVVDQGGTAKLGIASFTYDLGDNRSISGRAVLRNADTNFFVAYKQSGNKGLETYIIFGDPNAVTFRSSLIFKLVMPFELRL